MKQAYPNYYSKFRCIAEKCKHNCCIGWEIDVDDTSLSFYNSLNTPLGDRIRENIQGDEPHFVLAENERCPFLNVNNLCDIITECGEDAVCEICRLHPRFLSFYSDFCETGLGLCCEEAARIVLTMTEKFYIEAPDSESLNQEEREFFQIRSEIFSILQDRSMNIKNRFTSLNFSIASLLDAYLSLERLDEAWTVQLCRLEDFEFDEEIFANEKFSLVFEQLSCYFIFRHLADAIECCDYPERVRFAVMSCYLIGALFSLCGNELTNEKMIDIVRMYSAEIEYSTENTEALIYLTDI